MALSKKGIFGIILGCGCLAVIGFAAVFGGIFYGVMEMTDAEDGHAIAQEYARNYAPVTEITGEATDFSMSMGSNVSVSNGVGEAVDNFSVIGPNGEVEVSVRLSKLSGQEWTVDTLIILP